MYRHLRPREIMVLRQSHLGAQCSRTLSLVAVEANEGYTIPPAQVTYIITVSGRVALTSCGIFLPTLSFLFSFLPLVTFKCSYPLLHCVFPQVSVVRLRFPALDINLAVSKVLLAHIPEALHWAALRSLPTTSSPYSRSLGILPSSILLT